MTEAGNHARINFDFRKETNDLAFYRIILLIAGVLVPVFGYMYLYTDPDAYDPLLWRYLVSGGYLLAFVMSFFSGFVKKHIPVIAYLLHGCMMIWLPLLLYVNNLNLNYVLGYIMAFSAILLTFKDTRLLLMFILYSYSVSAVIALLVENPVVAPLIFIGAVDTTGLVLYFAVGHRNYVVKQLSENENLLKTIFNESADAIFLVSDNHIVMDCNQRALEVFQGSKAAIRGMELDRLCSGLPEKLSATPVHQQGTEVVHTFQLPCTALNGREFWGDIALRRSFMGGASFLLLRISDIDRRKTIEEELKSKQVQLENAQQLAHIGSWEWDIARDKIAWSDELYRIFGLEPQQFRATYEAYLESLHPEDRDMVNAYITRAFQQKEELSFEHRIMHPDGQVRTVSSRGRVITDEQGKVVQMHGTALDITERKQYEQKILSYVKEIEAANQELNRFAYIVSHDLKAPLRSITSLTSWLEQDYGDKLGEEGKLTLNLLSGRVQRMHNFIEGILEYSRIGRTKEVDEKIDLNAVVKDVTEVLSPPDHIRITIARPLPTMNIDHLRIVQVFQNLIGNAVKFMDKPRGEIVIDYTAHPDHYEYSVSDNGPGIEERHFDKVFEIFQTLSSRDDVEGTGIGLTIVKKIVEARNGRIWVESRMGEGTTIKFTFPSYLHV